MSEPAEIEVRVSNLETRMAEVHHLASRASHDVSTVEVKLRAQEKSLNALRETQVEHGQRLDRLEKKVDAGFARVDANFAQVNANFAAVDEKLAKLNAGQKQIIRLLTNKPEKT